MFGRTAWAGTMAFTKQNYRELEAHADAMYVMRDALDCEQMGFTVIDCEPGWSGLEHNHVGHDEDSIIANDHEEVYFLVEGEATIEIEGESVELEPGDTVRVEPEATRQIHNGDQPSTFVVAGAP